MGIVKGKSKNICDCCAKSVEIDGQYAKDWMSVSVSKQVPNPTRGENELGGPRIALGKSKQVSGIFCPDCKLDDIKNNLFSKLG